ncbi:MAG TPA: hypothetical protein VI815_03790 [Candidatus Nanoarchaeia archaeon]|nr:hypothetical protein [Candidatus Nanoarchaeia archaeon]
MKRVKGYVFMAEPPYYKPNVNFLFGQGVDNHPVLFEEELSTYPSISKAVNGMEEFQQMHNGAKNKGIYQVNLRYAETEEELESLKDESNLVVILMLKEDDNSLFLRRTLFGPRTTIDDGGTVPASRLRYNGYQTFVRKGNRSAFDRVLYCYGEIRRQGQLPCVIGQLNMKKVKEKNKKKSKKLNKLKK